MLRFRLTKPRLPALTLRGHLVLFGFLIVVPMLGASAFLAFQFERAERHNLEEQAKTISRELAFTIDREISGIESAVAVLATSRNLHRQDFAEFAVKAREVAKAIPGSIIVLRDPQGQQFINTLVPPGAALPIRTQPELVEADRIALQTRQLVVSGVYTGLVSKLPYISVELAVDTLGGSYLLGIAVTAERFRELLLSRSVPPAWLIALIDADHKIVTRSRDDESYTGTAVSSRLATALDSEQGVLPDAATRDGVAVFTAYHRVPCSGWYVVSSIPRADLVHPLQQIWLLIGGLAGLGLATSIGSAALYGRRLAGAFSRLDKVADAVGKSKPVTAAPTGVTELDKLGATLTQASRDLEALTAQRAELLGRLLAAQESERQRLSRELHDQTGQSLAAALLEIKRIEGFSSEEQRERLRQLRVNIDRIGQVLHRVAWELRPASISELGLVEALANLTADWSGQTGIEATCHCSGSGFERLPETLRTTIYRVVQEALTNVAKHADAATRVTVTLSRVGAMLRLVIEDDGRGFDLKTATSSNGRQCDGLGLVGMRERLSLVGGEIEIESAADAGTTIFVRLPFDTGTSAV